MFSFVAYIAPYFQEGKSAFLAGVPGVHGDFHHKSQVTCFVNPLPQLRAHLPSHRPLPTLLPSTRTSPPLDHSLLLLAPGGTGRPCYAPLCHILLAKLYSQYFLYFSLWSGFLWGLLVQQRYLNIHWLQMLFTGFLLHWVHQEICLDTAASNS